jgi:hypothetical protein
MSEPTSAGGYTAREICVALWHALQPIVAWFVAVLVGAVVGVALIVVTVRADFPWSFLPIVIQFGVMGSWLFAVLFVYIAHKTNAPRPLADIVAGALVALILSLTVGVIGGLPLVALPSEAIAGAIAGLAYWLVAGSPQPPYDE